MAVDVSPPSSSSCPENTWNNAWHTGHTDTSRAAPRWDEDAEHTDVLGEAASPS